MSEEEPRLEHVLAACMLGVAAGLIVGSGLGTLAFWIFG